MTRYSLARPSDLPGFRSLPGAVVLDARSAADYWTGHLEGALHIDAAVLTLARTDAASLGRFQAQLAWVLSTLGVTAQSPVLVYGAQNEVNVSRAAWALGYAGIEQIRLLDGGLAALPGAALSTAAPAVTPKAFELRPHTAWLATADEVLALSRAGGGVVVDARERDEFEGLKSNARRKGRVPGARHWDTRHELGAEGLFNPPAALSAPLDALGTKDQRLVAYCGGGGRAARSFIAWQLAGRENVAVYPASWAEWGNRDELPVSAGDEQAVPA